MYTIVSLNLIMKNGRRRYEVLLVQDVRKAIFIVDAAYSRIGW